MIRGAIDTNVFVSSFFGGNPKKIIDLWKNEEIVLCLSKDILDEYIDVLQIENQSVSLVRPTGLRKNEGDGVRRRHGDFLSASSSLPISASKHPLISELGAILSSP
jgi:predicted nucleic acid-binding protein